MREKKIQSFMAVVFSGLFNYRSLTKITEQCEHCDKVESMKKAVKFNGERFNYMSAAKIAEQSERYDEVVESMKKVAKLNVELNRDERDLLCIGYKKSISILLSSYKNPELNEKNKERIASELHTICKDAIAIIDKHLILSSLSIESVVLYFKMKGDFYCHLAELRTGNEREKLINLSFLMYEDAMKMAERKHLPGTNCVRLSVALNMSLLFHDFMEAGKVNAICCASLALKYADFEINTRNKKLCKHSILIMKLLRDNLALWLI